MARSHMNMPIICVRSFCGVNEVPDFTNCKRVPGRAYNGANGSLVFRTQEVREILGEACDFANPEIYAWLGAYLKEQMAQVQGKEV